MATTKIYRTFTSGNTDKWTWSAWVKRGKCGATQGLFAAHVDDQNRTDIKFNGSDQFVFEHVVGNSYVSRHISTRLFRDTSAWYHIVVVWDTGNASEHERQRLYINGVEENDWGTATNCAADTDSWMNNTASTSVCNIGLADSNFFDGCMSHIQFVDGLALAPTDFGTTDSTTGIWKIKTASYGTPGTNGFHLKFENSGNLDLDSSSNTLTFTTGGNLIQTKDNPSNNFTTLSRFFGKQGTQYYQNDSADLKYGNLSSESADDKSVGATFELRKGKWYWETKLIGNNNTRNMGIVRADMINNNGTFYNASTTNGTENTMNYNPRTAYANVKTTDKSDGTNTTSGMISSDSDAIIGHYLDMDNGKMCWSLDGTLINSGASIALPDWADGDWTKWGAIPSARLDGAQFGHYNFGNGYFGTTAVASSVADAGGEGLFEYNPTATIDSSSQDFRCINTKNIATYG